MNKCGSGSDDVSLFGKGQKMPACDAALRECGVTMGFVMFFNDFFLFSLPF